MSLKAKLTQKQKINQRTLKEKYKTHRVPIDFQRISIAFQRFLLIFMGCLLVFIDFFCFSLTSHWKQKRNQWTLKDKYRIYWVLIDFQRFSMIFCWFSNDFHGFAFDFQWCPQIFIVCLLILIDFVLKTRGKPKNIPWKKT